MVKVGSGRPVEITRVPNTHRRSSSINHRVVHSSRSTLYLRFRTYVLRENGVILVNVGRRRIWQRRPRWEQKWFSRTCSTRAVQ